MLKQEDREAIKNEILQEINKEMKGKLIREDTQSILKKVRDKWFKGDRSNTQNGNGKMEEVMDIYTAWKSWEQIRKLTCYISGVNYVRHLAGKEEIANEIAEEICELVYRLTKKHSKGGNKC